MGFGERPIRELDSLTVIGFPKLKKLVEWKAKRYDDRRRRKRQCC